MGELTWNKYKASQNITQDKIKSQTDLLESQRRRRRKKKFVGKGCFPLSSFWWPVVGKCQSTAVETKSLWMCVVAKSRWKAKSEDLLTGSLLLQPFCWKLWQRQWRSLCGVGAAVAGWRPLPWWGMGPVPLAANSRPLAGGIGKAVLESIMLFYPQIQLSVENRAKARCRERRVYSLARHRWRSVWDKEGSVISLSTKS